MTAIKANKLKQQQNREEAEIRVLSGPKTTWRTWLLGFYAKVLQDTGQIPVHLEMYRPEIEETDVHEPDTRLQPKVVAPTPAESADLNSRWEH